MIQKFDIDKLVRENIRNLKPYRSARDDFDSGILLDANENGLGAPFQDDMDLHRYPMPHQELLRDKIADFRSVKRENVFVGVGSDEAIDLLFRIFCTPEKDRVIINPPTYGMYKVSAAINDVAVDEVLLTEEFQLRPRAILDSVTPSTKIVFICSPNNPTANSINNSDILSILQNFEGIVVVDEAYIDFSTEESFASLLTEYPNLVVLQTMSKSFGLAGIRLGVAFASPEIIQYMMKVKAPYNVNKLTSKVALEGFNKVQKMKENVQILIKERNEIAAKLDNIPEVLKVHPSDANFLLFKINNAYDVYQKLATEGVVIRYRGNEPFCEDCLRLTIGSPAENRAFLDALKKVLSI